MSSLWSGVRPGPRQADPLSAVGRAPLPSPSPTPSPRPLTTDVVLVGVAHPPLTRRGAEGKALIQSTLPCTPEPRHRLGLGAESGWKPSAQRSCRCWGGSRGRRDSVTVGRWELLTRRPVGGLRSGCVPKTWEDALSICIQGEAASGLSLTSQNNGGILSPCQVGIHSLSFWYQTFLSSF